MHTKAFKSTLINSFIFSIVFTMAIVSKAWCDDYTDTYPTIISPGTETETSDSSDEYTITYDNTLDPTSAITVIISFTQTCTGTYARPGTETYTYSHWLFSWTATWPLTLTPTPLTGTRSCTYSQTYTLTKSYPATYTMSPYWTSTDITTSVITAEETDPGTTDTNAESSTEPMPQDLKRPKDDPRISPEGPVDPRHKHQSGDRPHRQHKSP